jgi:TolA-binding protein
VAPAPPTPSALAAENALYARAIAARDRHDGQGALATWVDYLTRYPHGVLAPEAAAGVLSELVAEGRDPDALRAADQYLASFGGNGPGDGRAAEVAFIKGNLLHDKLGRTADALSAYQLALRLATRPALRDDALFAIGACQKKLGFPADARRSFERYRREFPNGAHAAELPKWEQP